MDLILNQFINGLQRGSIYALIALGYTMVYGVLRLINFAHGEVFMIGAFAAFFAALLAGGGLVVALLVAMCVCGALGLLMELGVYRPLRSRPRLAALIAAIGLSIFLSNLVQALRFDFRAASGDTVQFSGASYTPFPADAIVANMRYRMLPGREVYITRIQLLNLSVSVALMAGLWVMVRRTMLGRAMRACANNQESLSLMGVSVNRVIAVTFGVGAALAGAAGVLNALTYPRIDATMGLMAGLKAFVAAVLGGIGSIPGAVAGGFIMGVAEVAATGALPSSPVDYTPLADGVAFALLILVLLVRPQGIFGEAESEKMSALLDGLRGLWQFWPIAVAFALMLAPVRLRAWPWVIVASTLVLTPLALGLGAISLYAVRIEALIFITAILAVSLNLINGLTGLFSIGHAGFAIVGGYAAGILTTFVFQLAPETSLPLAIPAFVVSLVAGGMAAAAFGFLVGLPTLRLRGDYLAIATLGFGEIICVILRFITFNRQVGDEVFQVGGPRGIQDIPAMPCPVIPGMDRAMPVIASFAYSLVALALIVWAIRNLSFSSHGRACAAIREDEVAAEILGVDTVFYKVGTFTIGAFFAGVGGGLLAHWSNMLHPSMGNFVHSIEYLIIIYIGGVGSISGSLMATALLVIFGETLKDVLRGEDAWRMVLYGAILVIVMLWRPGGLYGNREFQLRTPRRRSGDGSP